jgi:AhpD family alkylhydroperoxidase
MPRIDLFTSPDCPSCPGAREVVTAFVAEHPGVEVREWDLATNPGPAVGRGIFAAPSLLLNGVDVLLGVPTAADLLKHFAHTAVRPDGVRHVLVVNAYEDFLRRPVFEGLSRAGYVPCPADSVEAAVQAVKARSLAGVVVALNPVVSADAKIVRSGIGLWVEILARVGDPFWAARPIIVTATSRASAPLVRSELTRHGVRNPVLIVTKSDAIDPGFPSVVQRHLDQAENARSECHFSQNSTRRRLRMPEVDAQDAIFEEVKKKFGFVPNLIREMSRNPAVARVYLDGQAAIAGGVLSQREQQVIQLAVSVYNECDYCRAAHRLGTRMAGVAPGDIEAIQKGAPPEDARLRSLVSATWQVLDVRGSLTPPDLRALEAEGVDRAQLYEIVAIVGLKTVSNYINHIAHTPIDEAFRD